MHKSENYIGFYLDHRDREIVDIICKLKGQNLSEYMRSVVKDAINNIKQKDKSDAR